MNNKFNLMTPQKGLRFVQISCELSPDGASLGGLDRHLVTAHRLEEGRVQLDLGRFAGSLAERDLSLVGALMVGESEAGVDQIAAGPQKIVLEIRNLKSGELEDGHFSGLIAARDNPHSNLCCHPVKTAQLRTRLFCLSSDGVLDHAPVESLDDKEIRLKPFAASEEPPHVFSASDGNHLAGTSRRSISMTEEVKEVFALNSDTKGLDGTVRHDLGTLLPRLKVFRFDLEPKAKKVSHATVDNSNDLIDAAKFTRGKIRLDFRSVAVGESSKVMGMNGHGGRPWKILTSSGGFVEFSVKGEASERLSVWIVSQDSNLSLER